MTNNDAIKEHWNQSSDEYYARTYENTGVFKTLISDPWKAFPSRVAENIRLGFPDLRGVKVCVPSSGDNTAAFGFHLLGAEVTSCDISIRQIENARQIADQQGWNIDFRVCDSMEMVGVPSDSYDLVYTSNGVHTWISDLPCMHAHFHRVLRKGGQYIFFETHPFIRPFDDHTHELKIKKPYADTSNNDWRVQDFVNSLIQSGFAITRMDELSAEKNALGATWWEITQWDEKSQWRVNPYAALPQWISFCALK